MTRQTCKLAVGCAMIALACSAGRASARESLGVFSGWGAFADARDGRCYAIAQGQPDPRARERQPYMTVATWPLAGVRGQVFWHLARTPLPSQPVTAQAAGRSFRLRAEGAQVWAQNAAMDAAIRAAMRTAQTLTVFYRDSKGRRFYDRYRLAGAPTALDAATLACARRR